MSLTVRHFFGLIILLLIFFEGYTQDPASDIDWYESFFQERSHPYTEKSLTLAAAKLDELLDIQDMPAAVQTLNELGLLHLTRVHDNEKALDFFIRALVIEDSLNLQHQKIFTYMGIAHVFELVGDVKKNAD